MLSFTSIDIGKDKNLGRFPRGARVLINGTSLNIATADLCFYPRYTYVMIAHLGMKSRLKMCELHYTLC